MIAFRFVAPLAAATTLAGCGTYVPNIQENPFADEKERAQFIQEIARNVRCEVQDAVVRLYDQNPKYIDPYNRNLGWFDSWAVQLSLTLTIDEKTAVNPVVNWLPPSPANSIFNLGASATVSTDAQRVDKIGSFFLVSDLKNLRVCKPADRHRGPFILESDLKLYDWLKATMITTGLGDTPAPANPNGPLKSNVLSHEVKFDIVSTGAVTPGWKLTTSTVNQSGTLFSTTRDRTQDLTITFGPPDPTWKEYVIDPVTKKLVLDPHTHKPIVRPTMLAPAAADTAFIANLGVAFSNAFRNVHR